MIWPILIVSAASRVRYNTRLVRGLRWPAGSLCKPGVAAGIQTKSNLQTAKVAELVDALDLGSSAARRESSSLSFRTKYHDLRDPVHVSNC